MRNEHTLATKDGSKSIRYEEDAIFFVAECALWHMTEEKTASDKVDDAFSAVF